MVALTVGVLLAVLGTTVSQEKKSATKKSVVAKKDSIPNFDLSKAKYLGAKSCKQCHSGKPKDLPQDFVQLDEYDTWHNIDKHSQAYQVLAEPRAQRMGKLLGYDPRKADACLSCHAMNLPESQHGTNFSMTDGVSCDGCHGPSEHWLGAHTDQSWRLKSGPEKERYGMIDVRDPVKRARMCVSCHVGNAAKGRIITHEMYAAGHPPLPSFELATYSRFLPRHWRLLREVPFFKSPKLKNPPPTLDTPEALKKRLSELYDLESADFEESKLALLGGIATFQETMKLQAVEAAEKARLGIPNKPPVTLEWPELARFDCYGCHHELKNPSWRQIRGFTGVPGRPQMQPWPTTLAKVALLHDNPKNRAADEQYKRLLRQMHAAFNIQPFGNRKAITSKSKQLANWAGKLINQLEDKPFKLDDAKKLERDLLATGQRQYLDYDSARQIGWALQTVHRELVRLKSDPKADVLLEELDGLLRLKIPYNKKYPIVEELPKAFKAINDYNPPKVIEKFRQLSQHIEQ